MNTKSKIQPAILTLLLLSILLPMFARGATNQTIYQTSFEPPVFTPGLPIRGQDNWEMFHDGEAISISTNNARSGTQCVRMDGRLLEQTGPNSSAAFCFSEVFLDNPPITPPPIVELTAYVRLDGPQTGTDGASTNDLMSANLAAVADAGGSAVELGSLLVSSAGRIFTWGSRPEDRYKYSAPMTFGAYQKLVLRVDFIARTVRYFANDVELGFVPFASSITSDRLAGGYLVMAGPVEPLITPYHYDPADYTAYFDDYSIVSVPVEGPEIVVEQGVGLTSGAATVDFGGAVVGGSSQRTFTIRNFGNQNLTGLAVTMDGPNAADFTLTASPAGTLNPGSSTTFTLRFSPATAGTRRAVLHIASNDADENPFNITLTGSGVLSPVEIAQQAYLKASNTGVSDFFGVVAMDGDTVVVGAGGEDSNATGINGNQSNNSAFDSGAAYVFVRSGTNWAQQAYLKASNTGSGDYFGSRVAISGDTVLVGALGEASNATGVNGNQANNSAQGAGAAYVFVRNGTNWTQQAYLKASNTEAGDTFGAWVAISEDTIVIGATGESSNATGVNGNQNDNSAFGSGAAYVFVRNGTNWTHQAYLKASNTGAEDNFGTSVSISGDTLVVGAGLEDSNATGVNNHSNDSGTNSGAAYVFVRSGTNWAQQAYLKASNTGGGTAACNPCGDFFGDSVAVWGDTIVVGAPSESSSATGINGNQNDNSAQGAGAAYVFVRKGTNWNQQAYLKASNSGAGDNFGSLVALVGDTIVVAAFLEDSAAVGLNGNQNSNSAFDSGAAYVFVRSETNWIQQAYLKASNTGAEDNFGVPAVSGNTVVIGAPLESSNATGVNGNQNNNNAPGSGAVYVFTGVGPFRPELRLTATRNGDMLQLTATGTTNTNWRLESRDDLTGTNAWRPLTNITLGPSPTVIQQTLTSTNRFYRGAWLP
jgi:hypothetical protein